MKSKLKYIGNILLAMLAGYVIGSIHAPFELNWRTKTALPEYIEPSIGDINFYGDNEE